MVFPCLPCTPALEGEQFLPLKAVGWLSGKGQHPGGPGGLCRSLHTAPLSPGGFQEPRGPMQCVAPSAWHLLGAKSWGCMTGFVGTRSS